MDPSNLTPNTFVYHTIAFPFECGVPLFLDLGCAMFLARLGVKIQWLFFANQFIHYLKKCEVLVECKGTTVFHIRKVCVVHGVWTIGLNLEGCIIYISRISVCICLNLDTLLHKKSKWRTKIR
jgi:hypothetical protein